MAENTAGVDVPIRQFSTSEEAVLRQLKVDDSVASRYPKRFPVGGVCELVEAGIAAETVRAVPSLLTPKAIIAFIASDQSVDDVSYDERFFDPRLLAEAGIAASLANSFPPDLNEVDVVRLHESGATPDLIVEYDDSWAPVDIAKLVERGVGPLVASQYRPPSLVPTELVPECIEAGVRPDELAHWIGVVGPAVRTERHALVSMALASSRRADPNGFRGELLGLAIKNIEAASNPLAEKQSMMDALTSVLVRGGELSTSIPNSWNRRRHLYVGPQNREVAIVTVVPDEPLLCAYGETPIEVGLAAIQHYSDTLG